MFHKYFALMLAAVLSPAFHLANAAVIKIAEENSKPKEPWGLQEDLSVRSLMRRFNGTWISDSELYYRASDRSIHKYNAASDKDVIFFPSAILSVYGQKSSFEVSPDNKKILIRYDDEQIFRHSSIAKYDIYDLETNDATKIHNGEKIQYCEWSPVNGRLAYVYENNVYVHFEDGSEIQLTKDGVPGVVYNGVPDWVYEEEVLSTDNALWWSPDGNLLAIVNFNDVNVSTFHYAIYGNAEDTSNQYPKDEDLKYPKPGTPNPTVEVRVFNLGGEKKDIPTIFKAPSDIVSNDHIMGDLVWTDHDNLLISWMNRRQNICSMQSCNIAGECREVKRFEEPNGWIKMPPLKCQSSGETCVLLYWIDDWMQAWKMDLKTGNNLWQSRGDFTVVEIYGYDEVNDKLYYQATLKGQPYVKHVFRNGECLTCNLRDVDNQKCLNAAATFSKNLSYYSVTCLAPGPYYVQIFETKSNKLVKDWEANDLFRKAIANKQIPVERFMNVSLPDGSTAIVRLKVPPNLDETKKHPLIVYSYGGPDSVRALNIFELGFDAYLTTSRSVIVATIDGRGTGYKGKKMLFSVNNNLGTYEAEDQLYVAKYLQQNLPYIDRDRTGLWGWSYGGFLTAKTLSIDKERIFQAGVSVAPVTSWLYYDSIYTERYMGLPTEDDNLKNYESTSVFKNVENFKTHDFLLMHGSADDNVHYQQSMALAKVLEKNDILFEQMTYVDQNHAVPDFSTHLYHTMDHFWNNYLGLDADEE